MSINQFALADNKVAQPFYRLKIYSIFK